MGSEETNVPRRTHSDAGRRETTQIPHAWPPPPCVKVTEKEITIVKGNNNNTNEIDVSMSSYAQYCYYMLEAMPQPGPTWSTTGPSILAEPTPTPTPTSLIEASQDSSSCTSWWLGYLEGFDGNLTTEKKLDPPFVENAHESSLVDAIDLSFCCPDDWLVFPTMDQDLGDIVIP